MMDISDVLERCTISQVLNVLRRTLDCTSCAARATCCMRLARWTESVEAAAWGSICLSSGPT
jgi:hypothetical protein